MAIPLSIHNRAVGEFVAHRWRIRTNVAPFSGKMRLGIKIVMSQRDDPRHNLRLPPALKAKLAHAAIDGGRSMNAEILARLDQSFEPDAALQLAAAFKAVQGLTERDRRKLGELMSSVGAILAKPSRVK